MTDIAYVICPECNGKELTDEESGVTVFCELCNGDGKVTQTDYDNWLIDMNDGDET